MARTTRSGHRNILARPIRKLRANGKAFLPSPEAIRSLVSPSFCGNLHDLLLNRPRLLCSALSSSLSLPLLHLFLLFSFSSNFNGASLTVPSRAYMYTDLLGSFLLIFFFFFLLSTALSWLHLRNRCTYGASSLRDIPGYIQRAEIANPYTARTINCASRRITERARLRSLLVC